VNDSHVTLAHGGGGLQSERLLREVVFPALGIASRTMDDSAVLAAPIAPLAFTTDSFVVQPLFFPGGDIGRLAVCGTVNDLATAGAHPFAMSLALIIEEGFEIELLRQVCQSIAATAAEAEVAIVAGDTKVIERQSGGGLFINTTGIGYLRRRPLRLENACEGDVVLINGTLADHGAAVMAARGDYGIHGPLQSDAAPLNALAQALVEAVPDLHVLKDPTRGGVAMALHEIALAAGVRIELDEQALPVAPPVAAFCDLLGLDPLEVANEGKLLVVCPEKDEALALEAMRNHPLGRQSVRIGMVCGGERPLVTLQTRLGGRRVVGIPAGELLPRIC